MKRFCTILLLLAVSVGAFAVLPTPSSAETVVYTPAAAYQSGSGTQDDPFLIGTPEQLMKLSADATAAGTANTPCFSGVYFKLACDLVMNTGDASTWATTPPEKEFRSIGQVAAASKDANTFCGVFDGDGHTISGLYIDTTGESHYSDGLFGDLGAGAIVRNLSIVNSFIRCDGWAGTASGSLYTSVADSVTATVTGVYSDAIVVSNNKYAGGIVGGAWSGKNITCFNVISDCVFAGSATGKLSAGGIMGFVEGSSSSNQTGHTIRISDCLNTGTVTALAEGANDYVGGILGKCVISSSVLRCINTGEVVSTTAGSGKTGAIFGGSSNQTGCAITLRDCYYTSGSDIGKIVNKANYSASKKVGQSQLIGSDAIPDPTVFTAWTKLPLDMTVPTACLSFVGRTDLRLFDGASVRLTDPAGLRFTAGISKSWLDGLRTAHGAANVSVGMLIAPTDLIPGAFTVEGLANPALYLDIPANVFENEATAAADEFYLFNAAIVGIKAENYTREFSARLYVRVTDGADMTYTYADYDATAHTRTVAAVAQAALADTSTTETEEYAYLAEEGIYSRYSDTERATLTAFVPAP